MQVVHNLVVLGALLLAVHTLEVDVGNRVVHILVAGVGNQVVHTLAVEADIQVVNHRHILGEVGALEEQTLHMVVVLQI
jgi:hypothetical protein